MSEPTILIILREDHKRGWHGEVNKYCPSCQELLLVHESEEFLKFVGNKLGEEA